MAATSIPQFAPYVGADEYAAIGECFAENWLTEGTRSAQFVARLRELVGVRHAVLAPNGTLALYLALRALDIGRGDEVIVPDCTFFGSASAVEMTGATPVFCDVDPDTLQSEAAGIAPFISSRTKAIMAVHLFGSACEMAPILDLARVHGLKVIEDAAQAIGVSYNGRHAGAWGDAGCFSFFADKTITTGEGGLVVTDDDQVAERLARLRNQGRTSRGTFVHEVLGYNFRITDIQAAVGLAQLTRLDEIVTLKQSILAKYRERLADVEGMSFLKVPPGSNQVPFRTVVFVDRAHELMRHLNELGIQTRTVFLPLHRQPAFEYLTQTESGATRMGDHNFPGANRAFERGICLPSHPGLALADLDYICESIRAFHA